MKQCNKCRKLIEKDLDYDSIECNDCYKDRVDFEWWSVVARN